jgi:hypothetical protein
LTSTPKSCTMVLVRRLSALSANSVAAGGLWCFRCARRSLAPPAGATPAPKGLATHRESSLGLAWATNWPAKRRQSDIRAVTKVKRFSLVTNLILGPTRSKTGKATVGTRTMARVPETQAGSKSMARMDEGGVKEPGRSTLASQEYAVTREAPKERWTPALEVGPTGSTPSMGKPCTWGSGGADDTPVRATSATLSGGV